MTCVVNFVDQGGKTSLVSGDGVDVGVGTGLLDSVVFGLACFSKTPLFQTNFFPDLIQVYFLLWKLFTNPIFEQVNPGLGGFAETEGSDEKKRPAIAATLSEIIRDKFTTFQSSF
jgi:hypothetical protein